MKKYNPDIFGFMLEKELDQLSKWSEQVPHDGVIVEVGSFLGRSAVCYAMSADPSVKIYCIDDYGEHVITDPISLETIVYDGAKEFENNTKDFPNIIRITGNSPQDILYTGDSIDLFFLDAAHTNPSDIDNIKYFLPFIKSGGLLAGHDYYENNDAPDIIENIMYLEEILNQKVTLYKETTLWSFRI